MTVASSFVDNVITFSGLPEDLLDHLTYFTLGVTDSKAPGSIVPNLTLWLNGGTGVTVVNGEATGWQDQSINYVDFNEIFAGDEPQYVENSLNFNPAIEFTSTSERLGKSEYKFFPTNTLTTFVVFSREDFADTQEHILSYAVGTTPLDDHFVVGVDTNGDMYGEINNFGSTQAGPEVLDNDTPHIMTLTHSGATTNFYQDGEFIASPAIGNPTFTVSGAFIL